MGRASAPSCARQGDSLGYGHAPLLWNRSRGPVQLQSALAAVFMRARLRAAPFYNLNVYGYHFTFCRRARVDGFLVSSEYRLRAWTLRMEKALPRDDGQGRLAVPEVASLEASVPDSFDNFFSLVGATQNTDPDSSTH